MRHPLRSLRDRPGPAVLVVGTVAGGLVVGAVASTTGAPDLVLTAPARVVSAPAASAGGAAGAGRDAPSISGAGVEHVSDGVDPTAPAPRATPHAAPEWVVSTAAATGIPEVAVGAYGDATLALAAEDPACGLGWTTLAALGALESGHGSHGGARLGADGRSSIPVVGPALDGVGVAAIAATPQGTAWHGDPRWEHAVGPMQFLPSTWARWGADGDGDGASDPHDLHDAALAAARYLCAGDRSLGTAAGWQGAILAYNRSDEYVADVLALADGYAAAAATP